MSLPPIINFGTKEMKERILPDVIKGKKHCALMISEPTAGSDVANIKTTAKRVGDHFIVNGQKKWITGGLWSDYFTTLVRTGGEGFGGLTLLLLEKNMPGIKIRRMQTMFDSTHGTTFVELEDVKVPVTNIIGKEGMGASYILNNFNHERFVIAISTCRACRLCYSEAIHEAITRKTFGKRLIEHQMIRFKLGEMARQIEALQAMVEQAAYQFQMKVPDKHLGGICALLKVQASKTFEYCARECVAVFGGSGLVREGRGIYAERLYRETRGVAIRTLNCYTYFSF
jgi:alkylation response protein AidB-like acyl-CoA dehydrogenase